MSTPNRPPMWWAMQDAGSNAPGTPRDAIAAARAALDEQQGEGEGPINWPAYFLRVADNQAREIEQMLRQAPPGMVEPLPAAPPAPLEGEVAELVELLHKEAADDEIGDHMLWMTPADARRAAELLQQQEAEILTSTGKPMTDYRALCAELFKACETLYKQSVTASHHQTITLSNGEHPIPTSSDMLAQDAVFGDLLHRTRAALAELASDGPAVPESREPASVAGKSSDENCWQWYTYCPEEGLEMYSDRKQAQSAAQSIMGSYEVAAHSDGWHEDMELVSWGMLVPVEQAQVVERKTAEPDDEFDEWVKYELRPVRYGHQPAPHDDRGVLPMVISDTGASDEPEKERIICASISGGADYINNMPRMLILERIELHKGSIRRRYIQEPTPPAEGEVAEFITQLKSYAEYGTPIRLIPFVITRAADLLERQATACAICERERLHQSTRAADLEVERHPTPVPVSERPWEREGWCDKEGRCWWGRKSDEFCNSDWHYSTWAEVQEFCSDAMPQASLPANALPRPRGEVE